MANSKIILAGGTGFLGAVLEKHFASLGWEVVVLTRKPSRDGEVAWDGESLGEWCRELEDADAIVNLCGRSVDCRYTPANRRLIMDSRLKPTRAIGEAIARCARPPQVWLNCSSATIYRHTFGTPWDETGADFTPTHAVHDEFSLEVIHAWEGAFNTAPAPHTRKVALRTTMVLGHARNSVFPVLRRLARLGLGGRMGSGRQFVSWLHQEDFCRAVEWLVSHEDVSGPVNLAAPNPLTNAEMMGLFRELVGMPAGLPAAEWMLEIGAFFLRTETELILKSRRVIPGKLLAGGFQFRYPTLQAALQNLAAS
ncbi:TIGR01777 family oxidoreductase [Prosthecobacter sp.]|uniref:TIGR01777 family oxidoreductase n=1 Tax=Prosthecobacter sp. TaxID=1965333 RepID=UPI0037835C6A